MGEQGASGIRLRGSPQERLKLKIVKRIRTDCMYMDLADYHGTTSVLASVLCYTTPPFASCSGPSRLR